MNLTAAVFLVNESVRALKVEYDPDNKHNNDTSRLYKTFDTSIGKGDLVIVPTTTRHGYTVAKVVEIDFQVDFQTTEQYRWVVDKVDLARFNEVIETEKKIVQRVGKAEENKMRAELKASMGLGEIAFTDLDLMGLKPSLPGKQGESKT